MHRFDIKLILIISLMAPLVVSGQERVDWSRSKAESAKAADFIPAIFERAGEESFEGSGFPQMGGAKLPTTMAPAGRELAWALKFLVLRAHPLRW